MGRAPARTDPRARLVDEWGELQAAMAPLEERARAIKDELALTVADKPGEQAYHVWGRHYELTISAGRRVRTIVNMLRIYKILGQETFLSRCSFPLAAVDEHLDLQQRAAVVKEQAHTGVREYSLQPLATRARAAA